jgi:hypothetical protein
VLSIENSCVYLEDKKQKLYIFCIGFIHIKMSFFFKGKYILIAKINRKYHIQELNTQPPGSWALHIPLN